jgi:GTP-binding protein LepA
LKSSTEGYASLDYEFFDHQPVKLVKLDILLNHEKVDAFSQLVVEAKAAQIGKSMAEKLKNVIPRHQFSVPIQAVIGGEIVAREDVKPFRKDVLQKLYGGDRSRKDKLLEAQKKGKKKMKMVGNVEIPQSAFIEVFKR